MTLLLVSYVCDYCDGLAPVTDTYHRGYVVWSGDAPPGRKSMYSALGAMPSGGVMFAS